MNAAKKVLFVDDDIEFQGLLAPHLSNSLNAKVISVSHPYEAIERLAERRFDLILLDWKMPALRGDAALKNFEKLMMGESFIPSKWFQEKIPVIIVSAESASRVRTIETQFFKQIGFVSKKQNASQLLNEIKKLTEAAWKESIHTEERPPEDRTSSNVSSSQASSSQHF